MTEISSSNSIRHLASILWNLLIAAQHPPIFSTLSSQEAIGQLISQRLPDCTRLLTTFLVFLPPIADSMSASTIIMTTCLLANATTSLYLANLLMASIRRLVLPRILQTKSTDLEIMNIPTCIVMIPGVLQPVQPAMESGSVSSLPISGTI